MDRPARVALVGASCQPLEQDLRELPGQPEVRLFPVLYGEMPALAVYRPTVAFVGLDADPMAEAGAVRMLQAMLPGTAIVLVGTAAEEVVLQPLADHCRARLLLLPPRPGDVAAALEAAQHSSDRPREDVFLDLARGIADEINNPLLFVAGYLQLLRGNLPPTDQDRLDQLDAALAGVERMQTTVERVQLIAHAANGIGPLQPVDLGALVRRGAAARPQLPCSVPPPNTGTVAGDPSLLVPAILLFVQVAVELHELDGTAALALEPQTPGVRLRLRLGGKAFAGFRLPRTFEPYYLNRVLRGSSHGLSLFLVQTVVHAHHGQALARRLPDGAIAIDLLLRG